MKLYRDFGNENKNADPKRVFESLQLQELCCHSSGILGVGIVSQNETEVPVPLF